MDDVEGHAHRDEDPQHDEAEILGDIAEYRLEGDAEQIARPGEAVGPDAGGDEVEGGETRPADHAHPHREGREIPHAIDEAETEDEADMVFVQHVEGD